MQNETRKSGKAGHRERIVSSALSCILIATVWPGGLGIARAAGQISDSARARVRQAVSAVGIIYVNGTGNMASQFPRLRGSAVVIRADGVIVTNYHVIRYDNEDRLYDEIILALPSSGAQTPSEVRYRLKPVVINKEYDLALLRVVGDESGRPASGALRLPAIELGDSRKIELMEEIVIIGFPGKGGATVTVNSGMVEGIDKLEEWIKTDARLMRGNSGGAAVDSQGRLIGIPSKVVADSQPIDKDGDGFPDATRQFGAVGFLRPAHLVASMLARLGESSPRSTSANNSGVVGSPMRQDVPQVIQPKMVVMVRGVVKSSSTGKPVAGARIGIIPLGSRDVTAGNLIAWAGTNAEGRFELNRRVSPGRYTLKVVALSYEAYITDVEILPNGANLVVELRSAL